MKLDLGNPEWRSTLPPSRAVAGDAPAIACAFNRDGKTVAFALGDGRVRLLPADVKDAAPDAGEPLHNGAVLSLIGDPNGDGFLSGGDDGRLLRIAPYGRATEVAQYRYREVHCETRRHLHPKGSQRGRTVVANIVEGIFQAVEGFHDCRQQMLPGLGQHQGVRLTLEQLRADQFLERYHMP